jgi:hypothetical protein
MKINGRVHSAEQSDLGREVRITREVWRHTVLSAAEGERLDAADLGRQEPARTLFKWSLNCTLQAGELCSATLSCIVS